MTEAKPLLGFRHIGTNEILIPSYIMQDHHRDLNINPRGLNPPTWDLQPIQPPAPPIPMVQFPTASVSTQSEASTSASVGIQTTDSALFPGVPEAITSDPEDFPNWASAMAHYRAGQEEHQKSLEGH